MPRKLKSHQPPLGTSIVIECGATLLSTVTRTCELEGEASQGQLVSLQCFK